MRGSRTCSFVARSLLSFKFACALGPFLLTPTPMVYGTSILAKRELNLARAASWSDVRSWRKDVEGLNSGLEDEEVVALRG